jgi:WD40-like Beta Propeller Repeat
MTGGDAHLSLVPDALEERTLDWLLEPDSANADAVLKRAFAELPRVRPVRPQPWDDIVDRLRPEPFGRPGQRAAILLVAVALLSITLVAGVVSGAIPLHLLRTEPEVVPPTPVPSAISATPSPARVPAVFPLAATGFEIVFEDSDGQLFTIGADGADLRRVGADIQAELRSPEWLPGTDRVIVQESTEDTDQIWDVETGDQRRSLVVIPCIEPCVSRNEASPSRDGAQIVYFQAIGPLVDDIPTECGLSIYALETLTTQIITTEPCAIEEERYPRFSPDGTQLAFWRSRSPGSEPTEQIASSAVFSRNLSTGEEVQLTEWSFGASVLDWAPTGEWIAFVRHEWQEVTSDGDIWRVRAEGSDPERLTSLDTIEARLRRPRYTPDGAWILFTLADATGSRLWGIPADGGEPVEVLPGIEVLDYAVRAPRS